MNPKQAYGQKLLSPKWQRKRLEIMNRDNFSCCLCGDKESTLNIHHLKYSGEPWECPDDFLKTLCESCHTIVGQQEINLADEFVTGRRIIRPDSVVYVVYTSEGAILYNRGRDGLLIHRGSIAHESLRYIVQDLINFWLQSDRQHYLTEKIPDTHG